MDGFSRKMRDKSACYLAWRRCENPATEGIDRPAWTISGLSPQPSARAKNLKPRRERSAFSPFRHKAAVVGDAFVRAGGLLARDVHFLQTENRLLFHGILRGVQVHSSNRRYDIAAKEQAKKKACLSAQSLRHPVRVFLPRLASPQPFRESEKSEAAAGCGLRSALFRCKVAAVGDASVRAGGLLARDVHFLQICPAGFGGVYARIVCGFDKAAKEPEVFMEAMKRAVRPAKTNVDNKKAALRSMRRTA